MTGRTFGRSEDRIKPLRQSVGTDDRAIEEVLDLSSDHNYGIAATGADIAPVALIVE